MGIALDKFAYAGKDAKKGTQERNGPSTGNIAATGLGLTGVGASGLVARGLSMRGMTESTANKVVAAASRAGKDPFDYVKILRRRNVGMGLAAGALAAGGIYNMTKKKDNNKV